MARTCEKCGKKPSVGFQVSHSERHTKRRFIPNLMVKKVANAKGQMKKTRLCTACVRTMAKAA